MHKHDIPYPQALVKPGVSTGALQEVFGKLAEGDVVVLRATDELRSGAAVTPKAPAPEK